MKQEHARRAADLLRAHRAAALSTLHAGAPNVALTPYALLADPAALVLHLSGLSAHTKDLRADGRCALLVAEAERADAAPHTLARVALQAVAEELPPDHPRYAAARAAYTAQFPDLAGLFELGDFALFALTPQTVRFVGGFAQAASLEPASLAAALAEASGVAPTEPPLR
jgi:putative heme iron utilization protein